MTEINEELIAELERENNMLRARNERLEKEAAERDRLAQPDTTQVTTEVTGEVTGEVPCKTHPDAPHGFDRNASHNEDRYVCECESWEPPPEPPTEGQTEAEKKAFAFGWWKAMEKKREWVGLTDEEYQTMKSICHLDGVGYDTFIRRLCLGIEAKLKEKNT